MSFVIKQDDTRPRYMVALKERVGTSAESPIDLTTATGVLFIMRDAKAAEQDPPKIASAMSVEDAVNGIVSYVWQAGDTDTVGPFQAEFEITWDDGGVETVPNDGYLDVRVVADLG